MMQMRDTITPISRCVRCKKVVHFLDEYCQLHWEDWLKEDEERARLAAENIESETEIHILFWSNFDPFAPE